MTLIWGEAEGTSNTMLYNAKEREREREQRNKSLQSNVMSRYNSYKLINEKNIVLNLANYEWKLFTKAQAVWLVTEKHNMSKSHTCVHELSSNTNEIY